MTAIDRILFTVDRPHEDAAAAVDAFGVTQLSANIRKRIYQPNVERLFGLNDVG